MKLTSKDNILARDKGDADYLTHEGPRGPGGKTRESRRDKTPDRGGRASYLKQEEKGQ